MTVSELVKELSKLPPEMLVFIDKQEFIDGNQYDTKVRLLFPLVRRIKGDKIVQRACKETAGAKKVLVL